MTGPRYAIYFAPAADEPLARFGAHVLGYDAETGCDVGQFMPQGLDPAEWRTLTAAPRRYGFHATLKAPFHLADGRSEGDLIAATAAFAADCDSLSFPLKLDEIDGFMALTPVEAPAALFRLERGIVDYYEPFRAPPDEAEVARRLKAPLTARQRAALDRYGYPYVREDFRFHMTLTGRITPKSHSLIEPALRALLATYVSSPVADLSALAVFRQNSPRSAFRNIARAPFAPAASRHETPVR